MADAEGPGRKDPQGKGNGKKQGEEPTGTQGPSTPIPRVGPLPPIAGEASASAPAPQGGVIEVTDLTWERMVEKAKDPVAVMFYSPTCAFCHQMEAYFREYAQEFRGSVIFARINIMASQWTPERYAVRSTPTFKFFCSGKPVQEMVGAVYPAILKRAVEETLLHGKECGKKASEIDYEITGYG